MCDDFPLSVEKAQEAFAHYLQAVDPWEMVPDLVAWLRAHPEKEAESDDERGRVVVHCAVCKREPHEIEEYSQESTGEPLSPLSYVLCHEGTYNPRTGLFWCTECYITLSMPLGQARSIDPESMQEP